jgi:hypothetical protein
MPTGLRRSRLDTPPTRRRCQGRCGLAARAATWRPSCPRTDTRSAGAPRLCSPRHRGCPALDGHGPGRASRKDSPPASAPAAAP